MPDPARSGTGLSSIYNNMNFSDTYQYVAIATIKSQVTKFAPQLSILSKLFWAAQLRLSSFKLKLEPVRQDFSPAESIHGFYGCFSDGLMSKGYLSPRP
jgi:hypothetical protein